MAMGSSFKILEPVSDFEPEGVTPAPRLDTLNGKVVGLYNNNKLNAAKLLEMVGDILSERYDLKGIVRGAYIGNRAMRRDEWQDIEKCDAIILTNGD